MTRLFLLSLMALSATAGEYAVLRNGFRIAATHHELQESKILLFTSNGNLEIPAQDVVSFEVEEYSAPAVPEPALVPIAEAPAAIVPLTPDQLVEEAARRHGLLPDFVRSVAMAESGMRVNAVSPKGAFGLMQLMPGTASELGADPKDPAQNVEAGTRYLRQLLEKYQDRADPVRLALAAYNAGPGAVDRYKTIPPYRETQAYVEKVVQRYLKRVRSQETQKGS